jgi:hypothetical protein
MHWMTSMVKEQAGQRSWLVVSGLSGHATGPSNWGKRARGAASVGEEADVANAEQSFGQNVKKKSAQERLC